MHIISGTGFLLTWLLFSDAPSARYVAALVPLANGARLAAIGTGLLRNEAAVKAISRQGDKRCARALRARGPGVSLLTVALCPTGSSWPGPSSMWPP